MRFLRRFAAILVMGGFVLGEFLLAQDVSDLSTSYIYWSDEGDNPAVGRLDYLSLTNQVAIRRGPQQIRGVVQYKEFVYWMDTAGGFLVRSALGGTGKTNLVTGLPFATGIEIDTVNEKIYFTDTSLGTVERINLDGSNREVVLTLGGLDDPQDIAFDFVNGKLYYTFYNPFPGSANEVRRRNLTGTPNDELVATMTGQLAGVEVDSVNSKVYWINRGAFGGTITRANLDGSSQEVLFTGSTEEGLELDVAAGKMLFTAANSIRRANLDGTSLETLVTGLVNPWELDLALADTRPGVNDATGNGVFVQLDIARLLLGTVTAEGDSFDTAGAIPNSVLQDEIDAGRIYLLDLPGGGGKMFQDFGTTATWTGTFTLVFDLSGVVLPFTGDIATAFVVHETGPTTFEIIQGTYNPTEQTLTVAGLTSFSDYGVGMTPEPSTLFLMLSGLFGLYRFRHYFRKS